MVNPEPGPDLTGMELFIMSPELPVDHMTPVQYENKAELQGVLKEHPELMLGGDEPQLRFLASGVTIGDAGTADLLFLDAGGIVSVAEVKLVRNGEKVPGTISHSDANTRDASPFRSAMRRLT